MTKMKDAEDLLNRKSAEVVEYDTSGRPSKIRVTVKAWLIGGIICIGMGIYIPISAIIGWLTSQDYANVKAGVPETGWGVIVVGVMVFWGAIWAIIGIILIAVRKKTYNVQ
jgi:hypothetical protein